MMLIGCLSLTGFPFLTGFYSKDFILEISFSNYSISGNFAYWLGSFCVLLTSYYSFRLLFLTFLNPTSSYKSSIKTTHDANLIMAIPLIFLAFGSIFVGFFTKDMMIEIGSPFWSNALFMFPKNSLLLESEYIPQTQKFLPLIFTFLGALFAFLINYAKPYEFYKLKTSSLGRNIYYMFNKRWFFDKVYNDKYSLL